LFIKVRCYFPENGVRSERQAFVNEM
jgi:hypothetical protein